MKKPLMIFAGFVSVLGLIYILHAQETAMPVQSAQADSIVQITADAQGLTLLSPDQVPRFGTFWLAMPGGILAPAPCPPLDLSLPIYGITDEQFLVDETGGRVTLNNRLAASSTIESALEAQATSVVNLISRIQTTAAGVQMRTMAGGRMSMDAPSLDSGGGGDGAGGFYSDSFNYTLPTNGLWLTLTNVSSGIAYLNLHDATDAVYEVFSKTDLTASAWNIEMEVWPTDTNSMPFTVPVLNRTNLFVWARDWTGITSLGNQTPEWWFWKYFQTVNLSDTNLDSSGLNTLFYDYQNSADPNVIQFAIEVTNNYVNTSYPNLQLDITAGIPFYYAVLINDTNTADASWQAYTSSNVVATLGSTDDTYNVSIGLRGFPANATQTWQNMELVRDTSPTKLVITNLASYSGSRPFIDPAGYSTKALGSLTFDVTNADGTVTHDQGSVVDQDLIPADMNHTTNRLVCLDVALTTGTNYIGIHAIDWAGNVTSTNFSYVFNTSGDTTPPTIAMTWPQTGMEVSGNHFTLRGTLDDDTATVSGQWTDTNGVTQTVSGLVERGGRFWLENMPLNPGTNVITVTATDAAGNPASTNLTLVQSGVSLTMDPMDASQLNHVYVEVSGEISDPDYAVWVNGVEVTNDYDTDGITWYWWVDNVPVTSGGTASFDITAYPPGYAPTGNSWTNFAIEEDAYANPQPADPVQLNEDLDKPVAVYVKNWQFNTSTREQTPYTSSTDTDDQNWSQGGGGYLNVISKNTQSDGKTGTTTDLNNWTGDAGDAATLDGLGSFSIVTTIHTNIYYTDKNIGLPPFQWVDYTSSGGVDWGESSISDIVPVTWTATGAQVVELFTGGKPMRQEKSLFILSDSLSMAQFSIFGDIGVYAPGVIAPESISLGSYGNLHPDGTLELLESDGQHVVVTPKTSQTWYSGSLPGKGKYTLTHQTECTATGNPDNTRTTIGIGEVVYLSGMPGGTVWSVSGGGHLSSTKGGNTLFTASLIPGSATVTAQYRSAPLLTVTFKVIPPSSITVLGYQDNPSALGTQNPNGSWMAALTAYTVAVGPTNVSFANVTFGENTNPATMTVTWPNGTNKVEHFNRMPEFMLFCGEYSSEDDVGSGGEPVSYLFNGTTYVDFSYTDSWTDRYLNEAGAWTDFCTMTVVRKFRGSDKKCQITYQGVPGGWQGPFQ